MFTSATQSNGRYPLSDTLKFPFKGNSFSLTYNSRPDIENWDAINPSGTLEFKAYKYSLSGEIENNNYKKLKSFIISDLRSYYCSQFGWDDEKTSLSLNNLDLTFESKMKDTLIYEIKDASTSTKVSSFSWFFDDKWEGKQYSQGKADLKTIKLVFINK